jgi:hypothetical protein
MQTKRHAPTPKQNALKVDVTKFSPRTDPRLSSFQKKQAHSPNNIIKILDFQHLVLIPRPLPPALQSPETWPFWPSAPTMLCPPSYSPPSSATKMISVERWSRGSNYPIIKNEIIPIKPQGPANRSKQKPHAPTPLLPWLIRKNFLKSPTLFGISLHFKLSLSTVHTKTAMGHLNIKWSTLSSAWQNWQNLLSFHCFLPILFVVWTLFLCTSHIKFLIFRGNLECHSSSITRSLDSRERPVHVRMMWWTNHGGSEPTSQSTHSSALYPLILFLVPLFYPLKGVKVYSESQVYLSSPSTLETSHSCWEHISYNLPYFILSGHSLNQTSCQNLFFYHFLVYVSFLFGKKI